MHFQTFTTTIHRIKKYTYLKLAFVYDHFWPFLLNCYCYCKPSLNIICQESKRFCLLLYIILFFESEVRDNGFSDWQFFYYWGTIDSKNIFLLSSRGFALRNKLNLVIFTCPYGKIDTHHSFLDFKHNVQELQHFAINS